MSRLPQLRVRTEFTFKTTYAPVRRVAERLAELGTPAAGIVDPNTWGHVRWEKALTAVGVRPLFGREFAVRDGEGRRPAAWALAERTPDFYRFSTALERASKDDAFNPELLAQRGGVIVFAGAALDDPALFDYVDISPSSPLTQRRALALAARTGKPLVVTGDNAYAAPDDRDRFLAMTDRQKITPQWIMRQEELREQLRCLDDAAWVAAVRATHEAAERASAAELQTAPIIHVDGDLRALALEGKAERLRKGHIAEWTAEYEARLERELELIALKKYESYFLVVSDLVRWAKRRMLVGPARGSSAGSLLCYLIEITEVDPIPHKLLFERFIDVTRNDLPDIDIDFSDTKRDAVFEYLAEKYGTDNVARIGSINTLKARSVLSQAARRLGIPLPATWNVANVLIEYSSGDSRYGKGLEDTLANTQVGREFAERYPESSLLTDLEGHATHSGVHAAGVIVSTVPVSDYCTVTAEGIAQIDKPDAERLNLLKIDALGLRTLGIIEDAGVVTADELYSLKLDDPEVLDIFNDRKFCGVFQFEGNAQRSVSGQLHFGAFETLDHATALARPGPLGGGASNRYIARKVGREPVTFRHPMLASILKDTYGVVLYQEQVMQIVREIGKFSWENTTIIRKAMSGRKGKEFFDRQGELFIAGAAESDIPKAEAQAIWDEICTFGAWGMNRSHTVSYAIISYWCAWMKRYHPLEYAAACLRSAKDDVQSASILREMVEEGVHYVPFDVERSDVDWRVVNGELVGGFKNLDGYGPVKAVTAVEQRRLGTLDRDRIAKANVKFADLYPLHTRYGSYYADPVSHGISQVPPPGNHPHYDCRLRGLAEIEQINEDSVRVNGRWRSPSVLFLCTVVAKERRDENEMLRIQKRHGRKLTGPTEFLDMKVTDDTGAIITLRVDRFMYEPLGRVMADNLIPGEDVLLVRGEKLKNYPMVKVTRVRCLTRPEILDAEARTAPVGQNAQQQADMAAAGTG